MTKKNWLLLGAIVLAMTVEATPYYMATAADIKGLAAEKMVETNDAIKDGNKVAVRASDIGAAFYADPLNKAKFDVPAVERVKPVLTYGTGFVVPETALVTGKRPETYNFDGLEVGGFIFVPTTETLTDPVKSLLSTVASATKRYATVTDKTKSSRGKTVPVTVNTRVFKVIPVTSGTAYGSFTAPSDGAAIVRLADHVPSTEEAAALLPAPGTTA